MRRRVIQLAVLLAMVSVAANAQCDVKCMVTLCDRASHPPSEGDDHACHRHGKSDKPDRGDQTCQHLQLFATDSLPDILAVAAETSQTAASAPHAIFRLISAAPLTIILEAPPPSFPDLFSKTILRV